MTKSMYPNVEAYFKAEYPDLVPCLGNKQSAFWISIVQNTISDVEVARQIAHDAKHSNRKGATYNALIAISSGRSADKISRPRTVVKKK